MSIFSRRVPYDRKRLLDQADALRDGRRWRRSLKLYRQVLAAEPRNAEIQYRVAPLLARAGRHFESWESFRIAAEALERKGEESGLMRVHQQAVKSLPEHFEACRRLAGLELSSQQRDSALRTLVEGARRLRRRRSRSEAIVLLRDAREIDPWKPQVVIELARLLAREGQPAEALFLLDHLDPRVGGQELVAVRALSWRIEPSLRHTWRWLSARREVRNAERMGPGRARVRA